MLQELYNINSDAAPFEARIEFVDKEGEAHSLLIQKIRDDSYITPDSEDIQTFEEMAQTWCQLIAGKQLSWRASEKYFEFITATII